MTAVVNVRVLPDDWSSDPRFAYVGRADHAHPDRSGYFGNPFAIASFQTREMTLQRYGNYFSRKIELDHEFRRKIRALKDKVLVCFCAPKACHADVIAAWLDR